jgi:hypothetical protein
MDSERIVEVDALAKNVARGIALDFPGIDAEDIAQEILLKALENPKSVDGLDGGSMRRVFRKIGTMYAAEERYAYTVNSAQYIYTPSEVRGLLEVFFMDRSELNPPTREVPNVSIRAGGIVVALWDMDFAWQRINDDERNVLARRYRDDEEGLTPTERKQVSRATDALTRWLNIKVTTPVDRLTHSGPGARTATTNAAAQSITGKGYNE